MDTLGKTQAERNHVAGLLRNKYGTMQAAAEKMKLSKFTLSRILNGSAAQMDSLVKILIASGHLQKKAYTMPAEDLRTFYYLNGILNADLFGNEQERGKK
jgi:hypothetical protein